MARIQKLRQMIQNKPGANPGLQKKITIRQNKNQGLNASGNFKTGYSTLPGGLVTYKPSGTTGGGGGNPNAGPYTGPAAAPTPSAAPSTTGTMPWDASYESAIGAADLGYKNTLLGLDQKEQSTRSSYGFDPQYASDPYTRANMLQNSWDTSNRASTNSLGARGQLYSGATTNALDTNRYDYLKGYDSAQKEYTGSLADIDQSRLRAQAEKSSAYSQAENSRLQNVLQDAYTQALSESGSGTGDGSNGSGGETGGPAGRGGKGRPGRGGGRLGPNLGKLQKQQPGKGSNRTPPKRIDPGMARPQRRGKR